MTRQEAFKKAVWDFYSQQGRHDMPWRQDTRGYYILVSELMLQQTQVPRVIPKFNEFIERFPDVKSLANATLADVLELWLGLGYNRRARFLHASVRQIIELHDGKVPSDKTQLLSLPGIGPNTAGAIMAYAFNQPELFIETNIRTVYLHHFFANKTEVGDTEILNILAQTIDTNNPREWYWALMDYGTFLKTQHNNIAQSKHYKKQSKFSGSLRQMRGEILRQLRIKPRLRDELSTLADDERFALALHGLKQDGLVEQTGQTLHLAGGFEKHSELQ